MGGRMAIHRAQGVQLESSDDALARVWGDAARPGAGVGWGGGGASGRGEGVESAHGPGRGWGLAVVVATQACGYAWGADCWCRAGQRGFGWTGGVHAVAVQALRATTSGTAVAVGDHPPGILRAARPCATPPEDPSAALACLVTRTPSPALAPPCDPVGRHSRSLPFFCYSLTVPAFSPLTPPAYVKGRLLQPAHAPDPGHQEDVQ
jgi:hypothetical protein